MSVPGLGPSPAQITMMGRNIAARIAEATRRRRRRRRIAIGGMIVAVGLALTAAGPVVASVPPAVQDAVVVCFSDDDVRSDYASIEILPELRGARGDRLVGIAVDTCAVVYGNRGVFAPDPTVCELPDLRLGVFPNLRALDHAAFCRGLGFGLPPR